MRTSCQAMEETAFWQFKKLEARKNTSRIFLLLWFHSRFAVRSRCQFSPICQCLTRFFFSQVVDSKATVKRTTKPRRSSRTLSVENGKDLTSTHNGRATSGRNGSLEGETRGKLLCHNPLFVSSVPALLFKPFLPRFVPMTVAPHFDLSSRVNHTTLRKRVVLIQFRGL